MIRAQLDWAEGLLDKISSSARLDAEILLAFCLERDRSYLMTWPERELEESCLDCFRQLVYRRLRLEPVAYLVGYREFYSLSLTTTSATLVPRPETEMLVDRALEELSVKTGARVLELGTGTGAIALAIRQQLPHCEVTATDIDAETLAVAERNARQLGLDVRLVQSDWYAAIASDGGFDVIVSNPPYIAEHDPYLLKGDLPAEPFHALCSGPNGLEALEAIISAAPQYLSDGGLVILEHGWEQGPDVAGLFHQSGFTEVSTGRDFNGLERMTTGRWKP